RAGPAPGPRFCRPSWAVGAPLPLTSGALSGGPALGPRAPPPAGRGGSPGGEAGACLYFAVVTWTTVGYGDYVPTPAARPYAALEALIGYLFMAFFIPTLIHAMAGRASDEAA